MRRFRPALALTFTLVACAAQPRAQAPSSDVPVPANEPRAELSLMLELPSVSDCDERFALALYEDRGVELLSWHDDGLATPHCRERRVTVRYLPRRLTRDALLQRVREISRKMELVKR